MKKAHTILIVVVILILAILILNYFGIMGFSNNLVSKIVAGNPDKNCNVDSDCVIKRLSCGPCDCGMAVNKNWSVFCPFKEKNMLRFKCKMCMSPEDYQVRCINNLCEQKFIPEPQ